MERVEVKDVRVPAKLMRAMAAEAEAARLASAKVVAAEGEHRASRALNLAANVMTDQPAAIQLRYLQAGKISPKIPRKMQNFFKITLYKRQNITKKRLNSPQNPVPIMVEVAKVFITQTYSPLKVPDPDPIYGKWH